MDKFFSENNKWLTPAIAILLIVVSPMIAAMNGVQLPVPTWLTAVGVTIGLIAVAYGISVTETFAAKVASIAIPSVILALIAVKVFA
ncbi:hypothetical protein [Flavobacterium sp.]|uniref:hypothetical protein n=1 Tax=Flavobacterium sp. TaxID=239 RepID=UPI0026125DA2|nr:hypothetical protein [Flavobacterium sp.]